MLSLQEVGHFFCEREAHIAMKAVSKGPHKATLPKQPHLHTIWPHVTCNCKVIAERKSYTQRLVGLYSYCCETSSGMWALISLLFVTSWSWLDFACLPWEAPSPRGEGKKIKKYAVLEKEKIVFFSLPVCDSCRIWWWQLWTGSALAGYPKYLLKPVGLETGSVSGFVCRAWRWLQHSARPTLWHVDDGKTIDEIGHCAVLELHYWVNSALWWTLYIAQAALFGWCFGPLLCFVWWFSLLRTFAALICSARFSPNSLRSPLATLASCNFISCYCILAAAIHLSQAKKILKSSWYG